RRRRSCWRFRKGRCSPGYPVRARRSDPAQKRPCPSVSGLWGVQAMSDPVTEKDLALYIDDQIDPARRLEVERHLARNPALAAEVIDEMRVTHELRMSMADAVEAPQPASSELARRLQGSLG